MPGLLVAPDPVPVPEFLLLPEELPDPLPELDEDLLVPEVPEPDCGLFAVLLEDDGDGAGFGAAGGLAC